jgi:hypothetical protein
MRYRKLDANGDYSFGLQQENFWIDTPEGVAQAVRTRLAEELGDYKLDKTAGMDWMGQVLGTGTELTRNLAIQRRVLETPGVVTIKDYAASRDPDSREFNVSMIIDTIYGEAERLTTNMREPS